MYSFKTNKFQLFLKKLLCLCGFIFKSKNLKIMALEEVLRNGNYHLIDVREPMELEMDGQVEGAQNIPLGEVDERKEEILAIEKPVVLFCRSGNRSGKALDFLNSEGLKNGYNGGGWAELKEKLENS